MRNELSSFYDAIAIGQTPRTADLDAEGIPSSFRRQVKADVRKIHALRAEGSHGRARQLARECATELRELLGEDWDGPPPDPSVDMSPDAVAQRIWERAHPR